MSTDNFFKTILLKQFGFNRDCMLDTHFIIILAHIFTTTTKLHNIYAKNRNSDDYFVVCACRKLI